MVVGGIWSDLEQAWIKADMDMRGSLKGFLFPRVDMGLLFARLAQKNLR